MTLPHGERRSHRDRPMRLAWLPVALAALILAAGAVYYTQRLTTWLAYDDEGGYLYAAWRISLGEAPYRDFLTPQLPMFLYPGALVLALSGYSVQAARLYMVALTLGSAAFLFLALRRLWGGWPALLALAVLVPQQEYYWAARFFRPEAPMLFWATLGFWLLAMGYPQRRKALLALAGVALALSMLSKLFGALCMGGVALYLLVEGLRSRDYRDMLITGLWVGVPFLVCVGGFTLAFLTVSPAFIADVLGHHLHQGSGTPFVEVIRKTLVLYRDYVREQPLYVALAGVGLVLGVRQPKRMVTLFLMQIVTVLAFFLMTRELQARHMTYIVPSLAAGVANALWWVWNWVVAPRPNVWRVSGVVVLGALLVGLALKPHVVRNAWVVTAEEHDTPQWVAYLEAHTAPGDYVLSDYPGINFAARRPTTPLAAGLSRGATLSGQIKGADLIAEIERYNVQMVLFNVAQGAHQLALLQDYETFKAYVQQHFYLAERREYDARLIEIYARKDLFPGQPVQVNLGYRLALTGARWIAPEARPGEQLQLEMRWQATADMDADYRAALRLRDAAGHEWGLGSKKLVDIDRLTYWDERGLERALLVPTSQWAASEAMLEVFELPVALATPPGTYQAWVRVHPEGGWAGLPSLDPAGKLMGYDVLLGDVRVLPATEPPDLARLKIEHPLDINIGPTLGLIGISHVSDQVRPGDRLSFSLYWSASAPPTAMPELRLGLTDATHEIAAATVPLLAAPPDVWPLDQVLRGQYDLVVPVDAATGTYQVMLSLADAGAPDAVSLGGISVAGRQRLFTAPPVGQRVDVAYGGSITLLGYDLERDSAAAGDTLDLTLVWRCEQSMAVPYTVFTHLVDETNRVRGQHDVQPLDGEAPTTGWVPGEIIVDRYTIPIDADAAPGPYRIEVGLYDAATGLRLSAVDAAGAGLADDRALLPSVITLR